MLAVPVFLVLTFVRVAAMEPRVHEYGFARHGVEATTGLDRAQLGRAAREIVAYFRGGGRWLDVRVVLDGREQPLFNRREVLHMYDVKVLMGRAFRVHELAFAYLAIYAAAVFLWSRERPVRRLAREAAAAGAATVVLLGAAAVAVAVGFEGLFRQFHVLSFANDFWQLSPARDRLIQMYPYGFWFEVTLAVGLLAAAAGALLAGLGLAYGRFERRGRESAFALAAARRDAALEAAASGAAEAPPDGEDEPPSSGGGPRDAGRGRQGRL